ncbi:MAG TPA: glycosyltransferase family 39 protein [bacterium]|nr:glycosyltransferase family 39 protein [bacterium]
MNKLPPILAIILITIMLVLSVISLRQESAIMDEVAHIPAGYSYLTQRDYRLNPEHPPLLKDLSAIPLLFIKNINFPDQLYSWTTKVNGQWDFGFNFLYNSGNDADKIIFLSRLPMLLLLIALGFFIWRWTKKLYGKWPALLAIFLFALAPTFIAHGRYVTTDVGAAFGFFAAIYFFIKWLQESNKKNLILAGIFFGIAQLIKFSLFLLFPYFGLLLLIWIFIKWQENKKFFKTLIAYSLKFLLILIIGYILIYPVYLFHISNYPAERQISDTDFLASHFPFKPIYKPLVWMAEQPILRPYAQYFLGLFMVFQRATGGNTTYFLGEVTNQGWSNYFPIVYLIKTPFALHILTIISLLFLAWQIRFKKAKQWLKKYFVEISMLIFLIVYWTVSIKSNLNIGVRHILPIFPFVYILISGQIKRLFDYIKKLEPRPGKYLTLIGWNVLIITCLVLYGLSSLSIFPYYLTHFNELVGGSENGYKYVTDSNLDWGQDLKRLAKWVDEQKIEKIKVDYFGGATVEYYLGDKYQEWHGDWDSTGLKGWLAVSATFLQQGRAIPTKGWQQPTDYYMWLNQYEPVKVIGNSIFVFYID